MLYYHFLSVLKVLKVLPERESRVLTKRPDSWAPSKVRPLSRASHSTSGLQASRSFIQGLGRDDCAVPFLDMSFCESTPSFQRHSQAESQRKRTEDTDVRVQMKREIQKTKTFLLLTDKKNSDMFSGTRSAPSHS